MKTLKTAFLLTALTLLMLGLGQAFGGQRGMTMALVFAILMNGTAYFFSDKIALMSSGAQPISKEEAPRLYEVMERLAAKVEFADAENVLNSAGRSQRIRNRPQSEPCVRRRHARPA